MEEGLAVVDAVVVGAAMSSTGNGAPVEVSAVAVVVAAAVPRHDDHRTNLVVVAGR